MLMLANFKWYLIGGLFAVMGVYAAIQHERAKDLQGLLDVCSAQRALYETNLKQLQYLSNEQEKKLDASGLEIEALRKQFASTLEGMRKQVIPKKCEDAVKFAFKNRKELAW